MLDDIGKVRTARLGKKEMPELDNFLHGVGSTCLAFYNAIHFYGHTAAVSICTFSLRNVDQVCGKM